MNLALHGFLLQVFVSILNFQHGSLLCSAGEPGYLDFDNLPETNFSCQGKVIGGYYADVEAGCQMFHVCTIGQKDEIMDIKFLCLNGTVFDQETRVCERVDEVDCSKSERFYNLNLELYGNNAVTLSLHESSDDEDDPSESVDDHQQRTSSVRPSTTTTTTTTTSRPKPSTTPTSGSYQHSTGYPQHYQPQPPFPQVHTSQSKSLYDDKNGGYHHQYIFHNGERNNNQATSYQLFSNQGVSSTTVQPPQVHQIRYSSTSSPQIIHNEPSTVTPLFHATSSTIQTLLNSNGNGPAIINPIFHNHGIASTTEQFSIHSNNPREAQEYRDNSEQSIRPLEAIQSTNKGKVSKLTISPVPTQSEPAKTSQNSQQQRITGTFLPTPATIETTIRSFYPTPRPTPKQSQSTTSQQQQQQVTQHIHVPPPVPIPQLKPHQITINLPPPDIHRIVQSPSPLLPSQSRVIVTAKASVSDESGRPLNTTHLVTLPLPTIPASYDDYKEGDESFDPFYRDVPKIRNNRRTGKTGNNKSNRRKRSLGPVKNSMGPFIYGVDDGKGKDAKVVDDSVKNDEKKYVSEEIKDFKSIKESLMRFRDLLFSEELSDETIDDIFAKGNAKIQSFNRDKLKKSEKQRQSLEDLETRASKHLKVKEYEEDAEDESKEEEEYETESGESTTGAKSDLKLDTKESDSEEYIETVDIPDGASYIDLKESKEEEEAPVKDEIPPTSSKEEEQYGEEELSQEEYNEENYSNYEEETEKPETEEPKPTTTEKAIDVVILDAGEYEKMKPTKEENTEAPVEEDIYASTEIPIASTSEQTTETKFDDTTEIIPTEEPRDVKSSDKESKKDLVLEEPQDTSEKLDDKKPMERAEEAPKKKSSRIRSRGKISSRKKEPKDNSETQTTSDDLTSHKLTTTGSSIAALEAEQIDSHVLKDVGTRAIEQRGKNNKENVLQENQGKDGQRKSFGKSSRYSQKRKNEPAVSTTEPVEVATTELSNEKENTESRNEKSAGPERVELPELMKVTHTTEEVNEVSSTEGKQSYKEESTTEHYETAEPTTVDSEDSGDSQKETLSFKEVKMKSRHGKSMKFEESTTDGTSHRQDKSMKFTKEEEELSSYEYSTTRSADGVNSEEISLEYRDSTEVFFDKSEGISEDDDYEDFESEEFTERSNSGEVADSQEEAVEEKAGKDQSTVRDQEDSTEGVLKFTDELPKIDKKEHVTETKKTAEPIENTAQDYVDDNYEPENYKEQETSTHFSDLNDEKVMKEEAEIEEKVAKEIEKKSDEKMKEKTDQRMKEKADEKIEKKIDEKDEKKIDEKVEKKTDEKVDKKKDHKADKEIEKKTEQKEDEEFRKKGEDTELDKTESTTVQEKVEPEKKEAAEVATEDEQETTTASTTTTTTSTTTTTVRPTVPKLFKPITARKNYNYIPPTTTPNPVVIKPRLPLLNPKPAKPPKSYNELVPKPVIRKLPLLARKTSTTTTVATTTMEERADYERMTEIPTMMTMENSKSEENVLENQLEKKQEGSSKAMEKQEVSKDSKKEDDQDSSPSEPKDPYHLELSDGESKKDGEGFTPYPITRLTTLASTIEKTLKEVESATTDREEYTTVKSFTFMDVSIQSTTIQATTTVPEQVRVSESEVKATEEDESSTVAFRKSDYRDTTEDPFVTEVPTTTESLTTARNKLEDLENVQLTDSTTIRLYHRKSSTTKRHDSFNCLEKEMYRFYGDTRDCRLFHYCSPGFTSRQVLDFRFVCEEGTAFDEESQSCLHDVRNKRCPSRPW